MRKPEARDIGAILAERRQRTGAAHGQTYVAGRIAIRLDELRQRRSLTMRELAQRVGTSRSHVSRLLSGRYEGLTLATLTRLANALDCDLEVRFHARPRHAVARKTR